MNSLALRGQGCGQILVIHLSSLSSLKSVLSHPLSQLSSGVTLSSNGNSHWQKIKSPKEGGFGEKSSLTHHRPANFCLILFMVGLFEDFCLFFIYF